MNLSSFSIRRPTVVVCFVVLMLVVGLICFNRLGVEQMPDVSFPTVMVQTTYQGASAKEVELLVSKPLEDEISSVSGIKHISSTNQEGVSVVTVEFNLGTDIKDAQQRVRDKVSTAKATTLPTGVDEPVIKRMDPADSPILRLALSTQGLSPAQIYDVAKNVVKPRLEKVDNVANIEISGGTEREIQVLLDRDKLKQSEVSLTAVASRIASNSQNVPAGNVSAGVNKMIFRTLGEYHDLNQISDSPVNFYGNDRAVSVADVGQVVDTVKESETYAYFNGTPSVFIDVYKQSGSNTIDVVKGLKVATDNFNIDSKSQALKGEPLLSVVDDGSKSIRMNVEDVQESIIIGICLTLVVVYFFLGSARSTFITIVALPNSLIGSFILMYWQGFTLNVVSLMALSLSVGLLVDDAIVVRENIWRHMAKGADPEKAAIEGTREVTMAVVATTAVVMSVFLPVGLMSGVSGMFFKQLGYTVIFAMAISLFDAMAMAPLLSCYLGAASDKAKGKFSNFRAVLSKPFENSVNGFERFQDWLTRHYETVVRFCLAHRKLVLALSLVVFLGSLALTKSLKVTFMGSSDTGSILLSMKSVPGTSLEGMRDLCMKVDSKLRAHKEIKHSSLLVGSSNSEANSATLSIELVDYKERKANTTQFKEMIRQDMKDFPGLTYHVGDSQGPNAGQSPFSMYVVGDDLDAMAKVADQAKAAFGKIPDLTDLDIDYDTRNPEYQVVLNPARLKELGVSGVEAGNELRGMITGVKAAKFRQDDNEYDVRVKFQEDQRDLRQGLNKFYVPNMNNNLVSLADVATGKETTGPIKIKRRDRERYIEVSAELAPGGALGTAQNQAIQMMKKIQMPQGVRYVFAGEAENMADMMGNIVLAMGLAVILMYLVLASLYESVVQPLLIMLALPFAVVGGLLALFITGQTLDMFSLIGFVMLFGLVAKNSILLVDYTNQLVRRGLDRKQALVEAGKTRLRPILMTTIAIIAGMLPLAMALSESSRYRQSMGIAIVGGLLSSTMLTLLVIPASYEWMDDLRQWLRRFFGRPPLRKIDMPKASIEG